MKVQILACDEIELPDSSVWGCAHHALASIKGYTLQVQRYQRYKKKSGDAVITKDVVGKKEVEKVDAEKEDVLKAGTSGIVSKLKSKNPG